MQPVAAPAGATTSEIIALRYEVLAKRVAHWMFTNPGKPLTRCARDLGLQVNYLYMFVSSDTFKAKYAELTEGEDGFAGAMMGDFQSRLKAAATVALDAMAERISFEPGSEASIDAAEILINAAVKSERPAGGGMQVNFNLPVIPADVLADTRQAMLRGKQPPATIEGSSVQVQNGSGLPATE